MNVAVASLPQDATSRAFLAASHGDAMAALDLAARIPQHARDAGLLAAMVRWRLDAFAQTSHPAGTDGWPPRLPDPYPEVTGIPAITAAALTPEILGGAILHHGSLRVDGLVSAETATRLREGIDRALAARDAFHAGQPDADAGWYVPTDNPRLNLSRNWVEGGGAVWTADCPPMLEALIDALTRNGVLDHIAAFMGERPALSVGKSTLRRVPVTSQTDWHQDGSFLGPKVRAVNVWLALSDCGVDAPGLDVVGRRLPYVVQSGSHGAMFDWSVGPGMVDILAEGGAPVLSPAFSAGDALLFDHLMLHRTGVRPGMTRSRWAIESWFFAPTDYPMDQVPLLV